jgi:hypothetical protein
MLSRISSLFLAASLFMIFLGSTSSLQVLAVGMFVFIWATAVVNYKRLGPAWPHLLLPTFYLLAVASVFPILNPFWRVIFLVLAAFMFYVMEMKLGKESHFLQSLFLFSAFGIFFGIFAAQFYFHTYYLWTPVLIFVFSYLLIMQGFSGVFLPAKKYFSFITAFVCAQAAWGLSLWPTYFLVNAVIVFGLFYLLWIFAFSAFFGKLTRQKIYLQITLVAILFATTLSTAAFRPIQR